MILGSDKSGERVVMEKGLYVEAMTKHTEGDELVTRQEVNLAEKHLNGAANQMVRTFKFGEEWNHEDRIKSASSAQFNKVPSLGGLVKTHKTELKMRPVCYAKCSQCPNGPLAYLLSTVLDPIIEAADKDNRTEVESTEELCSRICEANARIELEGPRRGCFQQDGRLEVGSMDVKSFYPSIDVEVAAEEVKKEILESEVNFEGVNYEEAALFLACTMTQEQIDAEGLQNVVHRRKKKTGVRPGLTCKAVAGGPVEREKDDSWLLPRRRPAVRQKRRIIACMIKEVIRLVMHKHFYSFNNQLFRQTKGAGIGNTASEKLGKLLLKRFDRKFLKILKKCRVELDLYGRFVDDNLTALASLDPGVRFEDGKMTCIKDRVEKDREMPADARIFRELVKVVDSIYECVQFTAEVPSSQQEGKVPVLDLQLYVGEE